MGFQHLPILAIELQCANRIIFAGNRKQPGDELLAAGQVQQRRQRGSLSIVLISLPVSRFQIRIVPSRAEVTKRFESGEKAIAEISLLCPASVHFSIPVAVSQTFTRRSSPPVANSLPSRLTAMARSPRVCPTSAADSWPWTSQTFTVRSTLAEMTSLPSGENATELTQSLCPRNVRISVREDRFQILTTLSPPPEAIMRPSGLTATELTGAECPVKSNAISGATVAGIDQTRTRLSEPQVTRRCPSGVYASAATPPE